MMKRYRNIFESLLLIASQFLRVTGKKIIYLTFDDGPLKGTKNCYLFCHQQSLKATFFMVGKHYEDCNDKYLVDNIRNSFPQMLLANHSYTHANEDYVFFYQNEEMALQDFKQAQETLKIPIKIIRLPGNNAWACNKKNSCTQLVKPLCIKLYNLGFKIIGWDLEWKHSKKEQLTPKGKARKLTIEIMKCFWKKRTKIPNHLVLLMHDQMFQCEKDLIYLEEFIRQIRKYRFIKFETIDFLVKE